MLLGAKAAMIGAAAQGLDFRAGAACRRIEAVMMMMMARHGMIGPAQRRQPRHVRRVWAALYDDLAGVAVGDRGYPMPIRTDGPRELDENFLGFSHDHHVCVELGESGAGRGRSMRPDRIGKSARRPDRAQCLLGHAQFGRS